jgi:hypothetical protein
LIIKDPYGFEIDPAAARELRDAYRSYWPLVINMSKYLPDKPYWDALVRFKKMEVNLGASIRCPDGYTSVDEHEDLVRRDELFGKWRSRPPLTREEDVEEVHLFASLVSRSRPIRQGIASTFFVNWATNEAQLSKANSTRLRLAFAGFRRKMV